MLEEKEEKKTQIGKRGLSILQKIKALKNINQLLV